MALINCPECNAQVSSAAPSCPKCGYPIAQAVLRVRGKMEPSQSAPPPTASAPEVQTIERTSKRWKGHQLAAGLLAVGSCGYMVVDDAPSAKAAGAFIIGIVWFILAKLDAWWHHG